MSLAKHGPHKDAVGTVQVREYYEVNGEPTARGPKETVERVRSRLGEEKYNPFTNNCQNLCYWSKALQPEKTDATKGFEVLNAVGITLRVWSQLATSSAAVWFRSAKVATPLLVFTEGADIAAEWSKLPPEKKTKAQLAKIVIPKALMYVAFLIGKKAVVWFCTSTLASYLLPACCKTLLANFIAAPSLAGAGAGAVVVGVGKAVGGFVAANALPLALGAAAVLCLGGVAAWAWKKRKRRKRQRVRSGQ